MAQSPRINVTVTAEQHALLLELASLNGNSAASYLRSMLDQATPLLRVTVPMLRAASDELAMTKERAQELLKPALRELTDVGLVDQLDIEDAISGAGDEDSGRNAASASERGRTAKRSGGR